MNPKARITYRFEKESGRARRQPSDKPERGPASDSKVVPIFREELYFTADVAPWNSPFQDDAFALERLIRETDTDNAAGGRRLRPVEVSLPIDDTPHAERPTDRVERMIRETDAPPLQAAADIQLGEIRDKAAMDERSQHRVPSDDRRYIDAFTGYDGRLSETTAPPSSGTERDSDYTGFVVERRRDGGPSWLKVFASVAGAVLTGALFGYLVLSLFAGKSPLPSAEGKAAAKVAPSSSPSLSPSPEARDGSAAAPAVPSVPSSGAKAGKSSVSADFPERTYTMLQFGVFSNEEGMSAALKQLRAKGLAAAADTTDGYRVYAGLAADRVQAADLGKALDGVEVYRKEIAVKAVSGFPFNGKSGDAVRFFEAADALIRTLGGLTAGLLAGGQPVSLAADEAEAWKEAMRQWSQSAAVFRKGAAADYQPYIDRLDQSIRTASEAMEEYEKNVSAERLRNAQTALMEAVFVQKEWMGRF
ncbi:hypothetical protein BG53_09485 [Paenibacillus darwinianus]|uniref:SPOR domain-containing protein n=1 Tax=Paenibacillus darwinianus TaxID=1380763 RepID=A0A9W5RZE7_9BACL|nr:SPOR domain-containing protein [Paenibacillus darwinianus]EXX85144.1 hypothetical protein BG53_09485 [Paenibacillus darwinianus]EXX90111.1 hypothetical protein BG52_14190 [Paenibacillus darwinianus]EXX91361.1 hypothetical protein CH50_13725 [Paenibacillus darwinianus]